MDSSLDLHAPIVTLIFLWVLDLAYFSYDQLQKINVFSIEIERADADGSNSTRIMIRALMGEMFSAISLSLKIISILFFAVVYNNIDDESFVLVLQKYSGRLAMTSDFFGLATVASFAFLLMITAYTYCRASSKKSTNKTAAPCDRCELKVPLLRDNGDDISPRMAIAAIGV
mmetsp:Transcript_38802/g.75726  ORF Transcript_38802/g.75726 Transcript_38802/m.75726 type:complete len:172 (+) Transcript_38802:227-742(+)